MESWIPVTSPEDIPNYRDVNSLEINVGNDTLPFLEQELPKNSYEEPVEVIVFRVLYALLISVSLVMNLLLMIAMLRIKCKIPVIYILISFMILPDVIFYIKLIIELMNWGIAEPSWARDDWSCGLWQFASHIYPLFYSTLLIVIVYHSFITLFLDYKGVYEKNCKQMLPLLLLAITTFLTIITAPSGFYSRARVASRPDNTPQQQFCNLAVPSINGGESPELAEQSMVTYRLVYEIVLPYLIPLLLLAFPYVSILLGLMRSLESTDHSEYQTKMTVVVTLWVLTTYLMLHVPSVIRNAFSIFSVWHRLTAMFDAVDDPRVPIFQTYIHVAAYVLTIIWAIIRPALCFRYCIKLRKSLGP